MTVTNQESAERRFRSVGALVYGAFVMLFAYVAFSSRLLRPAADDYCLAVDAHLGVVGGAIYWFDNLSGYFTSLIGAMALVGWPVLNLPWGVGSAVAFLVAAITVGVAGGIILWSSVTRCIKGKFLVALAAIPIVAVAWWSYLWFPQVHQAHGLPRTMALILTHWQTNNGVYVFQTGWILGAAIVLWHLKSQRPWAVWGFVPLGIAAGFGGAALVATIVSSCLVSLIYIFVLRPETPRSSKQALALLSCATLLAGSLAQLAPGSLARQQAIGSPPEPSVRWAAEFIHAALPSGVLPWMQSFSHVGAAAVLVLGVATGWWMKRLGVSLSSRRLLGFGLLLLGVSLVASLSARITQLFAYSADWHFIPTWELTFLGLGALGTSAGVRIAHFGYEWTPALMTTALLLSVLVAIGSVLDMTTSMAEREARWAQGGATVLGGLADIEDRNGMVIGCWKNLALLRPVPDRGLTSEELRSSVKKIWGQEGGSIHVNGQ